MLVALKEIMNIAEEKNIAVGSFNASCLEAAEAELEAAEELKLPIIIQFAQCHEPWIPLTTIGPIMVEMAKKATIPVCVHLDHGCGKDRVPIYLNHKIGCRTIGVELMDQFKSVMDRMVEAYYEKERRMILFLYYPQDEYIAYLSTIDEVMFVDEIDCTDLFEEERITAGENDFVIYEETKRIIDNLKNVKLVIVDGGNS